MRDVSGHTATVGEIVGRVLQLWDPDNPAHESARSEEVEELLGFDLEATETAIDQAKKKGQDNNVQQSLESSLTKIRDQLETGALVRRELLSEIEAYRQDKDKSTLVVIIQKNEGDIYESEDVRITTKSAFDWLNNSYKIEIPEWGPAQRTVPELESALENARKYTNLEKEKHLITIAALLDLIADRPGGKYGKRGDPNRSKIASDVRELLEEDRFDLPGYSAETLRDRFSEAIKLKKEHITPQK